VAVHLGFPRKVFDWRVVILVSFDVETGEFNRETLQDVDDAALQVVFRSQAVVGIVPGPVHGKADTFDEALVVAVEEMLDIFRHLDVKESKVEFEEEKGGEHAVGFRSIGAGVKTESGSHAGPQDEASDGEFPPERAVVVFGAPITDKVQLERFAAFQKLFEEVDWLFRVQVSKEGRLPAGKSFDRAEEISGRSRCCWGSAWVWDRHRVRDGSNNGSGGRQLETSHLEYPPFVLHPFCPCLLPLS
jgi:hypothetical protein